MAEIVAGALGRDLTKVGVYGRDGVRASARRRNRCPRDSLGRRGRRHTVLFGGMGERMELTHRAQSRDKFARGALRAARFIAQAKPGLYSMHDVLGLK